MDTKLLKTMKKSTSQMSNTCCAAAVCDGDGSGDKKSLEPVIFCFVFDIKKELKRQSYASFRNRRRKTMRLWPKRPQRTIQVKKRREVTMGRLDKQVISR